MRHFPIITARQWRLQTEREHKRQEFRRRQFTLAAVAAVYLIGAISSGIYVLLALALLVIQCGAVEALRFRKCGTMHQTKRAIWRGSTPADVHDRRLLRDCEWPGGQPGKTWASFSDRWRLGMRSD